MVDSLNPRVELLETDGFLSVNVSRALQKCFDSVFQAAHCFFRTSEESKLKNSFPRDMGYRPYAAEYSASPLLPDQVESFSVTDGMISPSLTSTTPANILCKEMLSAYGLMELIAEEIIVKLANGLSGNAAGNNLRGQVHHWSLLQLNYSTPVKVSTRLINESHEDGALLTVAHAREPGLELLIGDRFVPFTNEPDQILVIPGDIAWLLSGGRIKPMFHRVQPIRNLEERMALLFFADINPALCVPWVSNETNQGIDIGSLVLKNPQRFGLNEWLFEDRLITTSIDQD